MWNLFQMLVFHPRQPAPLQEVAQGTTGTRVKKMIRALTSTFTSQGLQAPAQEEHADSPSCICVFFCCCRKRAWFCLKIFACVRSNPWRTWTAASALSCCLFRSESERLNNALLWHPVAVRGWQRTVPHNRCCVQHISPNLSR